MSNDIQHVGLEPLLLQLKAEHGFDFTGYRRTSLARRIHRRMAAIGIPDFTSYATYLANHLDEYGLLFNSILVNVTAFFRDAEPWRCIAEEVVPRILAASRDKEQVRVWCAGCASGEEPFSIAMLLNHAMGAEDYAKRAKIYATDWDSEALIAARRARYTSEQVAHVPQALRDACFTIDGDTADLDDGLRRSVIFGRHDLTRDPPIARLDLLICRNTLMYFTAATQARVLARLHFALDDRGFLFLGRAEMLLSHLHFFTPFELRHRVFTKVPGPLGLLNPRHEPIDMPSEPEHPTRFNDIALDASPVAQLVLDAEDTLITANQRARRLLQIGPPEIGRRLQDLEVSYRPADLRSLLDRVRQQRGPATISIERPLPGGSDIQHLEVAATPLFDGNDHVATSITFDDVTPQHQLQTHLQQFSNNLETAYEELQSCNEELEATNEELQSSNEELETTNEELQAINEEMETINEELRSTNDELHSANEQLRAREGQLDHANVFLQAILSSFDAGVAVVDKNLDIQVWNERAEDLWGARAEEVRGKNFVALDIGLPVAALAEPLRESIRNGTGTQVVLDAVNRRGRPLRCRITINPIERSDAVTVLMDVIPDGKAMP